MQRTVIHLDMNAFFASVEQQRNPALRGRPIAVVGSGIRTVVTTASYEARACGVKTGMTMGEARSRCPDIVFVPANNGRYADTCSRFVALCHGFTPFVEVFSIDEVFLDVTGSLRLFGSARSIVHTIKQELRARFGLTCSAGIAPNKLLAKLASDMEKPDGLVEIRPEEVAGFMEHLPVGKLCGIGSCTEQKLALIGITTCGELGRADPLLLRRHFGVIGEQLIRMGRGEDDSPVVPVTEGSDPKSIGHSMTFEQDIACRQTLEGHLLRLAEMVGRRARCAGFAGRTVAVTVRYRDFTTFTRRRSVSRLICDTLDIYEVARSILASLRLRQAVRLLGITLGNLARQPRQLELLPERQRQQAISRVLDEVNSRYGDFTLTFGSLLALDKYTSVISPSWRPCGPRRAAV
ncbi:MAG: DNA polymerase IV [Desulfobacterota bacterium]|nr:DNA polymerase IV [Thermodesulfobacteriota bacterium]